MSDSVMVIGGGIAGIQASLDLANAGCKVVLVEKSPAIGGKMAALDKNFPTLDCSICIEAPKMSEVVQNDNVEILTLAEVVEVNGIEGDFNVTIRLQPRFVTDECTRCDDCVQVCPQITKNEFDVGVGARKAIYTPYAQAEPGAYVIDVDTCLNDLPNYLPCVRCIEACEPACIDFDMKEKEISKKVASIVVATGFDLLDLTLLPELGYGKHPDILTSLEFERLLNAAGPSSGEIVKPSNGKEPENILFVLCVGSRDQRFRRYCSRVCCMYSTKEAIQAVDHGIKHTTVLYMDIRAYGKGFDGFYERSRKEGVEYIRGRPAEIRPDGEEVVARFEDTEAAVIRERSFDMVVLAPAIVPSDGTESLAKILGIEVSDDGFFMERHDGNEMLASSRPGIYVAGCASGPKDIPDSVAESGGASALAMTHITGRSWPEEIDVQQIDVSGEPRVGVFVCDCGSNIAGTVDVPEVVKYAESLPGVEHTEEMMFACAYNSLEDITRTVKEKGLTRCVVAACSPRTHAPTFQRASAKAGLNPYLLEMANVRNHDSWVHKKDQDRATEKAKDLVHMGVQKSKLLVPLQRIRQQVVRKALVVGGGVSGMTAAANLARQGIETHLVEKQPMLGGIVADLHELAPEGIDARQFVGNLSQELFGSGAAVHLGTEVENISGFVGNFNVHLSNGETLDVGAVILATGSQPYLPKEFLYGNDDRVLTNIDLEASEGEVEGETVTFISCVGSRNGSRGCSRYCCQSMIGQALRLREQGKRVRVLYKDIRTYGRHAEEMYEEACRKGVKFFQYSQDLPPEEAVHYNDGVVTLRDELSGHQLSMSTDLLVLTVGLVPSDSEGIDVAQQLKVSKSEDGFLLERHPKLGPVEAAVEGVYLCGAAQAPKDVRDSVAQALAAASKVSSLLSRDTIELEPLAAIIDKELCNGCSLCARVCPYSAIDVEQRVTATVIQAMCMGCGACAAECPRNAITMPGFTDEQIMAQIDAATLENPEEKVLVFACNWCSYAGADQAGIEKIQYPPSSRIIKTMCSARVSERFIQRAFERGAGAVLVSGCHLGDCHYITANEQTAKRLPRWQKRLGARGYDGDRLHLDWFTAAEGRKFAEKLTEMDVLIRKEPSKADKIHADGGRRA